MTLSCPIPDNYAAVALRLQETALEVEARIFDLEYLLRNGANRPTYVETKTASVTGLGANTNHTISSSGNPSILFANNPRAPGAQEGANPIPGVWHIGCSFNAIASGVVDNDSFRLTTLKSTVSTQITNQIFDTKFESNTGIGTDITLHGVFLLEAGIVEVIFRHGNSSSTITVSNWRFWSTWLGEAQAIRVVN